VHGAAGALASRGGPVTAPAVAAALPDTVRLLRPARYDGWPAV
jgi:hypothetical protein